MGKANCGRAGAAHCRLSDVWIQSSGRKKMVLRVNLLPAALTGSGSLGALASVDGQVLPRPGDVLASPLVSMVITGRFSCMYPAALWVL